MAIQLSSNLFHDFIRENQYILAMMINKMILSSVCRGQIKLDNTIWKDSFI